MSAVSNLKSSPEPETATALPSIKGGIRFRTSSAAELSRAAGGSEGGSRQPLRSSSALRLETQFADTVGRRSGPVLVVFASLLAVSFVLLFMPRSFEDIVDGQGRTPGTNSREEGSKSYAVVFDAGSSGSRVHVYCFDKNLELLHIGKEIELFEQKTPGLSFYAKDPQQAANSLIALLEKAESVVPEKLRHETPVRVGATAGLRSLGQDISEKILQAVRDLLQQKSSLKFQSELVTVLDGTQEGVYQWVTINYLLGKLGKTYSSTVGVVDLGGGSVQMAYAISEEDAHNAPKLLEGEDLYVQKLLLKGTIYYLYVHSYLHYGLLAARAEILKVADDHSHCILNGHDGSYRYGENEYKASSSASGANFSKCRSAVIEALKVDEPACTHMKCTFGGVWNGGGGDGQKDLFVASFFFDRAAEAGFIDHNMPVVKVKPVDFENAARRACKLSVEEAKTTYSHVQEGNLPYLCMDLVYQFTLLVDGLGLDPYQEITLVKQVQYGDAFVEAAWPLGSAIEIASTQYTGY